MNNRYLLEIGTEELPAEFMKTAGGELSEKVKTALTEEGLPFESATAYVTPRRLTLLIEGLAEVQESKSSKIKGPPTRVALDANGQPTQAGLGFARKMGVEFSTLTQETIDGEAYVVLNQTSSGRAAQEILAQILPDLVLGLSGSHFMFWGESTIKFSRPIRWIVSLWNKLHMPLRIGEIQSGTESRGHRVLGENPVQISAVDDYFKVLEEKGKVLANQDIRRERIWQQIQEAAASLKGRAPENPDLLETVTMLVENPSVVAGHFQERFLEIPKEVVTTVMAAHQKYFPVEAKDGDQLLPYFLTISNGDPASAEIIRQGNERVLTARLEDARFFFDDDRKVTLESRVEALKGITFQKGLGSMYDKTERLTRLSAKVSDALGYSREVAQNAHRGAKLSKTDLLTGMVRELTELQGVMGRKYAQLEGEDPAVCQSIYEQYLPRFMGDEVARSQAGIVVSLTDKLDTMMAVFSQKNARLPSGSKDPLGLRRMAAGVIQTVLENQLRVNLHQLLGDAFDNLGALANADRANAVEMVDGFILQRFKGTLLDQNIRYDIIEAVLEARNPLEDLLDAVERVNRLKELTQRPEAIKSMYEPANRIGRILGEAYRADLTVEAIQPALFKHPSEEALFKAVQGFNPDVPYPELVRELETLSPLVEEFFNQVLINDPDARIKENRYNLLSLLNRFYLRLARFSRLVV